MTATKSTMPCTPTGRSLYVITSTASSPQTGAGKDRFGHDGAAEQEAELQAGQGDPVDKAVA